MMSKKNALILVIFILILITVIVGVNFKKNKSKDLINPVVLQYREQAEEYEKKVKKNPEDKEVLRKYALALYATGKLDEALNIYKQELNINPNDAVLFNNIANIYRDKKEYTEAESNYKKSIQLKNTDNTAYNNLAAMYINSLNDKQKAIEVYEELLKFDEGNMLAKSRIEELKK